MPTPPAHPAGSIGWLNRNARAVNFARCSLFILALDLNCLLAQSDSVAD
jgi:hypothetical protein